MTLDKSQPLNPNNPTSLRLAIAKAARTRVGVANVGFRGTNYPKDRRSRRKWLARFEEAVKESKECVNGIAVERGKVSTSCPFYVAATRPFRVRWWPAWKRPDGTILAQQQLDGDRNRLEEDSSAR